MDGDIDPFIQAYLKRFGRQGGVSARGRSDELTSCNGAAREARRAEARAASRRSRTRSTARTRAADAVAAATATAWTRTGRRCASRDASSRGAPGQDDVRAPRRRERADSALLQEGPARRRACDVVAAVRHRRRHRRARAAVSHADRRSDGARARRGAAREVAPAAAVREGESSTATVRHSAASAIPSSATGSATPISRCIPRCGAVFDARAAADHAHPAAFSTSSGFLEVETPVLQPLYGGAAARPVRDASQRARHAALSFASRTSCTSSD